MRPFAVFFLLCLCLGLLRPTFAQDTSPTSSEAEKLEFTATKIAVEIQAQVVAVQNETARAFNLLGLFEAIGFFVTIAAGVGGLLGVFQLFSARQDLQKVREELIEEAQQLRSRFDSEVERHEQELRQLETSLLEHAKSQAQITSQALLANAMLPQGARQYRAGDYVGTLNT